MAKERILYGTCPSCETHTSFYYLGIFERVNNIPPRHIYNCRHCETTRTEHHIREHTLRKNAELLKTQSSR